MSDPQTMGWLCKRYFRVNRWSERYFVLSKDKLVYYTSDDRTKGPRGKFDLVKGCYISDITEVDAPTRQLRGMMDKVYCFTILWPQWYDPPKKKTKSEKSNQEGGLDFGSDGEFSDDSDNEEGGGKSGQVNNTGPSQVNKDQNTMNRDIGSVYGGFTGGSLYSSINQHNIKSQENLPWVSACGTAAGDGLAKRASSHAAFVKGRNTAAPTLDHNRQRHTSAVQGGAMVAGAVAGGAVVGAFTMGIGLIPYMAIVGGAAAVGGGTVAYHASNPVDHRLVLTARTLQEARRWKVSLEGAIGDKEARRPRPVGLLTTDRTLKMAVAWNSARLCAWHCDGVIHGLRLLRCVPKPRPSPTGSSSASSSPTSVTNAPFDEESWRLIAEGVCEGGSRKMSVSVRAPPLDVFLTLMAALNGTTPKDKNESNFTAQAGGGSINNSNGLGGGGLGGCGICSAGDKDILANSVFKSVLGRAVSSIHHLKKVDEHSDILNIRFHESSPDVQSDGKLSRLYTGLTILANALSVGMMALIGLNHRPSSVSLLSDGVSGHDGNTFFYSSSSSSSSFSSSSPHCEDSAFWSSSLGKLLTLVVGRAPRELIVERFWRVDEDGCFIVTLSSTSDPSSGWLPPLDSDQHARANLNIVVVIAPRRDYTSFHTRECQECQVEIIVSGSGGGAASKLREASRHGRFTGVSEDDEPYHTRLPDTVGQVASSLLREAASYLDEKFQLSVMKMILDLKATVEALEIAPPELALASAVLSEAKLASLLKTAPSVEGQDQEVQEKIEESLKRAGVWQLAQTLSPLAPPPSIVGLSGCPMNCGACGACDAYASDVYNLSQLPPLYPALRAPGFYFPSGENGSQMDKSLGSSNKSGVSVGIRKGNHSNHHHRHHHTRDGQVFENVWDDDGTSSDSDESSDSNSSTSSESETDEDAYPMKNAERRGSGGSMHSDEDIDELDLLDENGELIVGSDDEYLFENLVSDDDEGWDSVVKSIMKKEANSSIGVIHEEGIPYSPIEAESSAQKKKWGYGVFRSRRNKAGSQSSPSSSGEVSLGASPSQQPLVKTSSYRNAWSSKSKTPPSSPAVPTAVAVAVASANHEEMSQRARSSSGGGTGSSTPPNMQLKKSRSLSLEREAKAGGIDDAGFGNELKVQQEKLRQFLILKEKEAATLEQDIAHGPLVVATNSSNSQTSKAAENGSFDRRMQIVALQGKLAEISEAKKMLNEHIEHHGVLDKPVLVNPQRGTYRKRLKEAIKRRVNKRKDRQRKKREMSPTNRALNMDMDVEASSKHRRKYWRRSRRTSRTSKSKSTKSTKKASGSSPKINSANNSGSVGGNTAAYLPMYQQYHHKIELSPSSSAFSEKLKLLDRNDSTLFSDQPDKCIWGLVHSFRATHTPYHALASVSSSRTYIPSHWKDMDTVRNSKGGLTVWTKWVAVISALVCSFLCLFISGVGTW